MQLEQEISREKRKRNYKDKTSAYSSTAAHERYEFTYRYSSRTFAVFASSTIKQKSAEGEGVRTQAMNQTRAMSGAFSRHDVTRRKARAEADDLPRYLDAIYNRSINGTSFPKKIWLMESFN